MNRSDENENTKQIKESIQRIWADREKAKELLKKNTNPDLVNVQVTVLDNMLAGLEELLRKAELQNTARAYPINPN